MKKIVTVLGARPQFIKASVVSHAMRQSSQLQEVLVHTGQHFDANMSDVFFEELGMNKPDHFLDIHGVGHGAMTGRMLEQVENVLLSEKPDAVLVYGDTNSTLAGALAAAKLRIPVAHVEAGLRSFNMAMPEEINRMLTDRISRWLFTPTQTATDHLLREGYGAEQIHQVGDVMFDVALLHGKRVSPDSALLSRLGLKARSFVLATIHRAENTDDLERLMCVVDALEILSQSLPVVWPLHPRTKAILEQTGRLAKLSNQIKLIDPVGYLEMVQLEKFAALVATDSGGVQKEAFFFGVPCVTMRDETEWTELVDSGWNSLLPPFNPQAMADHLLARLNKPGMSVKPYGEGNAATLIVRQLVQDLL